MNRNQIVSLSVASTLLIAGCVFAASKRIEPTPAPPKASGWKQVTVVRGLANPWGMVWLPDGRILVTEKGGNVAMISGENLQEERVGTVPDVAVIGQGGLMDIALHPDFKKNGWVYFTAATGSNRANRTTLFRGVFKDNKLGNFERLFQVSQDKNGGQHFGSRLLWLPNKTMLMSIGDGGNPPSAINGKLTRFMAQDKTSHIGKVLCFDENGKPAKGNPFATGGSAAEIFSLGHRNIQGMALDSSGRIWANEHGARGGDELNMIEKGKNYGWPYASFSKEYSQDKLVSPNSSLPGYVDPKVAWTPCPAPSGLAFYTGSRFPQWKGDLFSGGLAGNDIRRIDLDSKGNVLGQQQLAMGVRIRDVRQGPDGFLYALSDEGNGRLIRIEPSN